LEHLPNGSIRQNQNTIVFLYPDQDGVKSLLEKARWVVAVQRARKDERVKATKEFLDKVHSRESDARGSLERECFTAYCKLGYPDGPQPRLDVISHLDTTSTTLSGAMVEILKKKGKLIESLGKDGIPEVVDTVKISDIYKSFKVDKSKKFLKETGSITYAIKEGILEGMYGYAEKLTPIDGKYEARISTSVEPAWEGYLIKKRQSVFSRT